MILFFNYKSFLMSVVFGLAGFVLPDLMIRIHKNAENSNSQATWRDTDRGSLFLLLFDEGEERKGSRGDTGELGMGLTQN